MFPGKGAHLVLNEEVHTFIQTALDDVNQAYSDIIHDTQPETVIKSLTDTMSSSLSLNWTKVKDGFGTKAYAAMPYKTGELRVTVVLTKQNELRLDIREWIEGKE